MELKPGQIWWRSDKDIYRYILEEKDQILVRNKTDEYSLISSFFVKDICRASLYTLVYDPPVEPEQDARPRKEHLFCRRN